MQTLQTIEEWVIDILQWKTEQTLRLIFDIQSNTKRELEENKQSQNKIQKKPFYN